MAKVIFKRVYHNPRERLKFFVLPKSEFSSTAVQPDTEFANKPIERSGEGRMGLGSCFEAHTKTSHHDPSAGMKMSQARSCGSDQYGNGAMHGIIVSTGSIALNFKLKAKCC